MISIAPVASAAAAGSYYTSDNYYTADAAREASGWNGEGAERAGLSGEVGLETFKAMLEGRLPDGSDIGPGFGGKHRPGIDMTFSAPKSLSMLAYIGGDDRLLVVNMAAAKAALAFAERHFAETRMQGPAGVMQTARTGNLVAALFQHDTNRNLDPQAHVHAVIANATQGPDGKWRALHNDKLWTGNTMLASVYHAHLRTAVEGLGYKVELTGKHGQFEIAGIGREAIMAFSTRREEVLEAFGQLDHQTDRSRDAVTLKTRARKRVVENRAELYAEWSARAVAMGLDLPAQVTAARMVTARVPNIWARGLEALQSARARMGVAIDRVRERLGISDRDPVAVSSPARARPGEIAAAMALGSAIRSLAEREAAFSTLQLTKTALDLGLPITADVVEKRIEMLVKTGELARGRGEQKAMLTTPGAISTEQRLLDVVALGRGKAVPVVEALESAGARLQAAAQARHGFALNAGQEGAGRLLLASHDRIVAVQGVAGAGKSSVLGAVAEVARTEGRHVIGLGLQNTLVNMLERDTGIASVTIAKFLGTHAHLLSDRVSPARLAMARTMFSGAIWLVDEASMASNDQALKLAALAERLEIGRLAFVGDKRQLGAVDAGKPFEIVQAGGIATAEMPINLRARSPQLIAAAAAANDYRPGDALRALGDMTTEVAGDGAQRAASRWLSLEAGRRDQTLLLASGRAIRSDINVAVQQGLLHEGVLGPGITLTVLDKVNTTREEERYLHSYAVGQIIVFERRVPGQAIAAGSARVIAIDYPAGQVVLVDGQGRQFSLEPQKLSVNRSENSVQISTPKTINLHEGDRIRWTGTDKDRGLINADRARVVAIGADGITVETALRMQVHLPYGDPMLQRLDLGYALNAHMAQGLTADHGIAVFDSRERNLTNARLFLVNITRVRDSLELIVDSGAQVERGITRNAGAKASALETIGALARDRQAQRRAGGTPSPGPLEQGPTTQSAVPNEVDTSAVPGSQTGPEPSPTTSAKPPNQGRPPPERQIELGL